MKKLKMIVTSVVVLAIVGSAFAFNAKKVGTFCTSGSLSTHTTTIKTTAPTKRGGSVNTAYYIVDWDGASTSCTGTSNVSANFTDN